MNIEQKIIPFDKLCNTVADILSSNMVSVLVAPLCLLDEQIKKEFAYLDFERQEEIESRKYILLKNSPVPLEESKAANLKKGMTEEDFGLCIT